ncbi:spore protease YyaC [Cohnella sp. GCM10027633]|uniref:spore protease YyaC n=1 Tax=unclassified Cohnella TaxID=2636738 RepID=UPI00362FF3D0
MTDRTNNAAKRVDAAGVADFIRRICRDRGLDELTFVCIGTDRSTGDSLGPLVGTMLEERGFPRVIGTMREPCDADRLPLLAERLSADNNDGTRTIIAIDACLGRPESVGAYLVSEGPLVPAQSVGRGFPPIGAYSIAAIVNRTGPKPYWTLQTTSLYKVMGMAQEIADLLTEIKGKPY